jgi:hypothetical protein
MKDKKVEFGQRICLYCGNPIESKYEDCTEYWECDCEDAKLDREIDDKISELKKQRPVKKFKVVQESFVRSIK